MRDLQQQVIEAHGNTRAAEPLIVGVDNTDYRFA